MRTLLMAANSSRPRACQTRTTEPPWPRLYCGAYMSISQLEALYSAYAAAIDAGDYDAAIAAALKALARVGTTPDVMRRNNQMAWRNLSAIQSCIEQCRKLKAIALAEASGGMQQTKVIYSRPCSY